jgi:hypothetical protein
MLRRTAAENLRYALKVSGRLPRKMYDSRIAELLSLVGLSEFGDRPARTMSGGEKRRLALARALAGDPAVLSAAAKVVEDVIGTVAARDIKVVMSTHDLGSARRLAGDIIFMQRGRVAETGAASTFFNEPHSDEAKIFIRGICLSDKPEKIKNARSQIADCRCCGDVVFSGSRPGQIDRHRLDDVNAGFRLVWLHLAAVQECHRNQRKGCRAGNRPGPRHRPSGRRRRRFFHTKSAEEKFLSEGFGVKRFPVMYNDFIRIGPKSDPRRCQRHQGYCQGADRYQG